MVIDFTNELVENEPGPNLYFMGSQSDFERLASEIIRLTTENNLKIRLKDLDYINLPTNYEIEFASCTAGNQMPLVKDRLIRFSLTPSLWLTLEKWSLKLAETKCHIYVEPQDVSLKEFSIQQDCNVVWSSEW